MTTTCDGYTGVDARICLRGCRTGPLPWRSRPGSCRSGPRRLRSGVGAAAASSLPGRDCRVRRGALPGLDLGRNPNWVHNLRATDGRAVLRHGRRETVTWMKSNPAERSDLRGYLQVAPGARPHIPIDRRAPLAESGASPGTIPCSASAPTLRMSNGGVARVHWPKSVTSAQSRFRLGGILDRPRRRRPAASAQNRLRGDGIVASAARATHEAIIGAAGAIPPAPALAGNHR